MESFERKEVLKPLSFRRKRASDPDRGETKACLGRKTRGTAR